MKTISGSLSTPNITNPTSSIPSIPFFKPKLILHHPSHNSLYTRQSAKTFNPSKANYKTLPVALCCSTGPNPTTDGSSKAESDSQQQGPARSNQASSRRAAASASHLSRGLVLDLGTQGSWDGVEVGSPVVKRFSGDDAERWYMWHHGRGGRNPDSDLIGLAISSNGIHWERGQQVAQSSTDVGLVMNCAEDWWAFDTKSIRPSEVMIMSSSKVRANSSVYWLYYTGFSSEELELPVNGENNLGCCRRVLKSLPGLAISQDGRNWARIEGEHHSGALFDVGSAGEWDSLFIASPHVVLHSIGDIRMYYHSFDPDSKKFAIGVARSMDGMEWEKLGKIVMGGGSPGGFDEFGAMNPCVVRDNRLGKYLMAYEGVAADGTRSIGLAISDDGLKDWRRPNSEAALEPAPEDGWDSEGVGSPCLVQMDGNAYEKWRLYYKGTGKGGRTGIGMAVSMATGSDEEMRFRRWEGFHFCCEF